MEIKQALVARIIAIKKGQTLAKLEEKKKVLSQKIASLQEEKTKIEEKIKAEETKLKKEEELLLKKTFKEIGAILDKLEGTDGGELPVENTETPARPEDSVVEEPGEPEPTPVVEEPEIPPSPKQAQPPVVTRKELLLTLKDKLTDIKKNNPVLYKKTSTKAKELMQNEGVEKIVQLSDESLQKLLEFIGGENV